MKRPSGPSRTMTCYCIIAWFPLQNYEEFCFVLFLMPSCLCPTASVTTCEIHAGSLLAGSTRELLHCVIHGREALMHWAPGWALSKSLLLSVQHLGVFSVLCYLASLGLLSLTLSARGTAEEQQAFIKAALKIRTIRKENLVVN